VVAKEWLDNHLLLQPYLCEWVETTLMHVVEKSIEKNINPQSAHVVFLDWLSFLANHRFASSPIIFGESNLSLRENYDLSVESRRSWWISSDMDPHCLFLRRPNEFEAARIKALATSALLKAQKAQWDLIKCGTDNAKVFDILLFFYKDAVCHQHVKTLREHFRNYLSFHYSERHDLVGVRFEPTAFKPQHGSKMGSLCAVIGDVAVPDVPCLTLKLAALLKGLLRDIKVRA
jgi:hypothetical protein